MSRSFDLPQPDPIAQAHSEKLQQLIRTEIAAQGPISFERFMEIALYQAGLGYYSAGAHKFGAAGDFITAPEISPLFSCCIAQQCQQILQQMSGNILELGAGSGVMAKDILLELETQQCLPQHYYILEISADLKQRQQELLKKTLPHLFSRIHWLDSLPQKKIQGVILANEVIDAMPVHKFAMQHGIKEYFVDYQQDKFVWRLAEPTPILKNYLEQLHINFNEGYASEANTKLRSLLASISDIFAKGLFLIIDYGFLRSEYYHPQRSMGTLMCHYRHRAHDDPLILIGLQDITTHVDFTAISEAAQATGMTVAGYTTQANFLLNCGITQMAATAYDPLMQYQLSQQLKRLLFPSEMGELFKAMALTCNWDIPLLGFSG